MSDSALLILKALGGKDLDILRYADLFTEQAEEPQETAEEIISKFDRLRRR